MCTSAQHRKPEKSLSTAASIKEMRRE